MHTILIVEDDSAINGMIYDYLTKQGYECICAYSGSEARMLLVNATYDVILLDLMLPGMCGEDVIHYVRLHKATPIIVISAKDELNSKVSVLSSGADDYICKPFDLEELLVRIQVQLRKVHNEAQTTVKKFKELTMNCENMSCRIKESPLALTKHEFKILELFLTNPNKAYSKQEIYEYAWNDSYFGDDKTINVHISNLRAKIAKLSADEYIQTVWGIGFKLKTI